MYTYTCKEVHNCPFKIRLRPEIGVLNSGCSEGRNQYYRVSEAIWHNHNAQGEHPSKDHALLVEITRKKRELEILHNRVEALCELIKKKYNRQIKNHRSELRRKLEKIAKLEKELEILERSLGEPDEDSENEYEEKNRVRLEKSEKLYQKYLPLLPVRVDALQKQWLSLNKDKEAIINNFVNDMSSKGSPVVTEVHFSEDMMMLNSSELPKPTPKKVLSFIDMIVTSVTSAYGGSREMNVPTLNEESQSIEEDDDEEMEMEMEMEKEEKNMKKVITEPTTTTTTTTNRLLVGITLVDANK